MTLSDITIQLPLENSTLIFGVVLLVILFSPLLLHRLRIPYIVGLIFAGILLGPKAFNILANDESFHLFGNVGILYILFLAGIDMDMNDFRRNRVKGMIFGLFTFSIPILIGTFTSIYILHFTLMTSLLLAAMYSSQTLVAYPITGRYGVSQNRAVNITVGGTILTDTPDADVAGNHCRHVQRDPHQLVYGGMGESKLSVLPSLFCLFFRLSPELS